LNEAFGRILELENFRGGPFFEVVFFLDNLKAQIFEFAGELGEPRDRTLFFLLFIIGYDQIIWGF